MCLPCLGRKNASRRKPNGERCCGFNGHRTPLRVCKSAIVTATEWPDGVLPYLLPNGWEWIRLGELGGFLGGGTPSKERAEFWDGKIPWVSPKDMKRPYMDDSIDHVSPLGVENSSGKMIPKGSLLMDVRGMILAHSFPVALAMRELTINQDMKAMQLALTPRS